MTINIYTPSSIVKFYSLKPGDVFRYEINGISHYFMKTRAVLHISIARVIRPTPPILGVISKQ
jgi:hypothetical protein